MSSRRAVVSRATVVVLGAVVVLAPPAPATDQDRQAHVSGALARAVAAGPAPAVVTWDREAAGRDDVLRHLARAGLRATALDGLSMAVTCAGGPGDLDVLASAPGAISVWGEESLRPAATADAAGTGTGAPAAVLPDLPVDGTGVSLAVVDTGLDSGHGAFAERVRTNVRVLVSHREFLGSGDPPPCQDFYTAELEDSELTSGHGTHLSGVAAGDGSATGGRFSGVAPGARIVGVGVSDTVTPDTDVRDSTRLSMFAALAGLNYALVTGLDGDNPVKAVLAGWVGTGLHDPYHPLSLAIRDLHHFGIAVVVPVGNGGPTDSDCTSAETCRFNPWAAGSYAIGVAAADAGGGLAAFSSRGDPEPRLSEGFLIDYRPVLTAPGEHVVGPRRLGTANVASLPGFQGGGGSPTADQTDTQHVSMTGTSVAAAKVAGAVLLMQEAARESTGCYLQGAQVRRILAETAAPLAAQPGHAAGAGMLDVAAAVAAAHDEEPVRRNDRWMCPGPLGTAGP